MLAAGGDPDLAFETGQVEEVRRKNLE